MWTADGDSLRSICLCNDPILYARGRCGMPPPLRTPETGLYALLAGPELDMIGSAISRTIDEMSRHQRKDAVCRTQCPSVDGPCPKSACLAEPDARNARAAERRLAKPDGNSVHTLNCKDMKYDFASRAKVLRACHDIRSLL